MWTVPTEPLKVPAELGIDHFAAFPTEMPRRIIQGWSPAGVCVECGEGRRPVVAKEFNETRTEGNPKRRFSTIDDDGLREHGMGAGRNGFNIVTVTGYACACPEPTAPTTPGVVLDPFGGTGTTALVAKALGRAGISVDMSADYCRLAEWRTNDPAQLAKAARKPYTPSVKPIDGQSDLLDMLAEEESAATASARETGPNGRTRIALPVKDIAEAYAAGETAPQIAARYGVKPITILRRLHEAGVQMRDHSDRQNPQNARKDRTA